MRVNPEETTWVERFASNGQMGGGVLGALAGFAAGFLISALTLSFVMGSPPRYVGMWGLAVASFSLPSAAVTAAAGLFFGCWATTILRRGRDEPLTGAKGLPVRGKWLRLLLWGSVTYLALPLVVQALILFSL